MLPSCQGRGGILSSPENECMSLVCWVQRISSVPRAGSCADLSCCLTGACPVSPAIKSANLIHFSFVQVLFFQFCPYHTAYSMHQEPKSYWSSTWSKMAAKGGKSFPGSVREGLGAAPSTCSDSSVLKCLTVPADKCSPGSAGGWRVPSRGESPASP